ncbi:hypothetical protein KSX_87960 [Ktedonospora formicarum]|uniref:Uncharacterized protein n=1 Tax=Ktedonospora formicarum TaxID=2778364 RepID=A0A8J3IB44_9CHLR|nr:hypothetical protein KSX_87960 [Ktedonospora formicarum]
MFLKPMMIEKLPRAMSISENTSPTRKSLLAVLLMLEINDSMPNRATIAPIMH